MSKSENKPNSAFDVRVQERHLRKNVISQKELDDRLSKLPDRIGDAVKMDTGEPLDPSQFVEETQTTKKK
jgi:hypothetical protein